MSVPVLATRLYIPPLRKNLVSRPRLIERLQEGLCQDQGSGRRLTLISAPAGFGKTTLVSEWAAGCNAHVAWLSLEEGDSDPARFLTYVVAALRTVAPDIGEGVLHALRGAQPQPAEIEAMLTALVNEITTISGNMVLVLDDYHVIDAGAIDAALIFLIEHLPPHAHLVIATREDPRLPLARLRARGQLTELRAAHLRFTAAESAEFLNRAMGPCLSKGDIAALEDRTEGWIAGLQLAALSMQGHHDVHGFIQAFAGDDRYILDYLVEEVLQRQPEPVRNFLLQTAILDRLCGPLCDAVTGYRPEEVGNHRQGTGQKEGSARLEALERGNFFVIPLDDKRRWYRYHHLFAEVLYAHLMAEQPGQVATLHRRASEWYEQQGAPADAIRHALAAEDFERAAGLIERAVPATLRSRQETTVLGWFRALPEELFYSRPVLSAGYAAALMTIGEFEGVEARLRAAERWLAEGRTPAEPGQRMEALLGETRAESFDGAQGERGGRMVVVDEEEFRRLPGSIAIWRAGLALVRGDVPNTVKHARRALDVAPEDDYLRRGGAAALLGLSYWTEGDLEAGHRWYAEAMARLERAGNISDAIGCAIALADIRLAQGRLHEAMSTYERGLQLATEHGEPARRGAADMHVGMSALFRERDDLDAATQHLLRSKALGEHAGLPQNRYRWRVAMARIREAEGDLDEAHDLLLEAERLYAGDFSPNVRPVPASKARLWIAQGRLVEALSWAREQGLSAHDDLSYLREFEHVTLARVFLAQCKREGTGRPLLEAIGLLERLLKAAEEGGRTGSVIEILVLQALAHQVHGAIPTALGPLQQALALAEPEGYVRTFVDEGPPMAQLLREAAARRIIPLSGTLPGYTSRLLAAFDTDQSRSAGASPHLTAPTVPPLIEPLSQRELEVLRLFRTELSGPEIADQLVIALSTLRTHTKGIYSKLNVNSRRAAVKRAADLGLI